MARFLDRLRSRGSRALMAPVLLTVALSMTWAWLASSAFIVPVAVLLGAGIGVLLFWVWWSFAEEHAADSRISNETLLSHLGIDGRGNRRLAIYDSNSGLYNRWYLELRLQEEFLRCKRYGVAMAVVVIRLGSLELTDLSTDRWGGVAANLAHAMAQSVRAVDITAALAPLEFAICLVHCDREGGEKAIERMQSELHGNRADVGLAAYPDDQCDGKALVELARGRMRPMLTADSAA